MSDLITKNKFPAPVDLAAVERVWRDRGYSCQRFQDPPGRVWSDFVHRTNEVVTVAQGRLQVTIEGTTVLAEVGDEVFIPRDAVHTVANASDGETIWMFGYD